MLDFLLWISWIDGDMKDWSILLFFFSNTPLTNAESISFDLTILSSIYIEHFARSKLESQKKIHRSHAFWCTWLNSYIILMFILLYRNFDQIKLFFKTLIMNHILHNVLFPSSISNMVFLRLNSWDLLTTVKIL